MGAQRNQPSWQPIASLLARCDCGADLHVTEPTAQQRLAEQLRLCHGCGQPFAKVLKGNPLFSGAIGQYSGVVIHYDRSKP